MIKTKFDIYSNDNTLFVTSLCDNRCLMCCQPPKLDNDLDYFYKKNLELIDAAPKELDEIGITGGEPTLLKERFFELLQHINIVLPDTYIHVLSNGRKFADMLYCSGFLNVNRNNLLVGIPLHSDFSGDHDKTTQVKGSYNETMKGLYNLGRLNIPIELRIVINKINFERLPKVSGFIYKNMPFVRFVSFMGMETIGWAVENKEIVWIDPIEYKTHLEEAVLYLSATGIDTAIFNIPHCLLPASLFSYATKSISDWKIKFLEDCKECLFKDNCCGLFSTSLIHSRGIQCIK
ncbi:MAG: His-Xaa-Ser system radical SAM maturase HxsC [Enterococcus sp.]|nr:His-Xaa-Ser system radical SAM maturase HxsC [Enterococcus sp.]